LERSDVGVWEGRVKQDRQPSEIKPKISWLQVRRRKKKGGEVEKRRSLRLNFDFRRLILIYQFSEKLKSKI
jgi:hypothetical protein